MEPIYLIIVGILMLLAVSDLIVGVSNDAVNFLNSAVGSKAAPQKIILLVAALGIMVGVLTSSGMMEVARNGVFNPGMFSFSHIMMLFLAVMLTDVILLDVFNTLGLPTSTTVSLVSELLGAAVCVALFTMASDPAASTTLSDYINSSKALTIITGILSSVVIAFVCGVAVMYLTRLLFTFKVQSKIKSVGAIWCGIALTAISYFALFKGLEGTPLVPAQALAFVDQHIWAFVGGAWVFWSALMFVLAVLRVNILKITVLAGTFALALAFAGNDLVNFIGVFMAGYDSYVFASATGDTAMSMGVLTQPVHANIWILLASGVVMVLTLRFSRKAHKVTETEVNLSRQEAGSERFGSTSLSRSLVRSSIELGKVVKRLMPGSLRRSIDNRFTPVEVARTADAPSFDLIRATVNLTVAALLISLATSLKLPLSTTYVSFMVAMGTSLADRAWGRDSAVYRITGVLTVISGWFLTAFVAFVIAFLVAALLMWGGVYAIVLLSIGCAYLMYLSNRSPKESASEEILSADESLMSRCSREVSTSTQTMVALYNDTLEGAFTDDRRALKRVYGQVSALYATASENKNNILPMLDQLKGSYVETSYYYVQVVGYLDEVAKALRMIAKLTFEHVDNNHEGFSPEQIDDLSGINRKMRTLFSTTAMMLECGRFPDFGQAVTQGDELLAMLADATKNQIQRNRNSSNNTRVSVLYFNILTETKTMVLQLRNLLKAQKYFVEQY